MRILPWLYSLALLLHLYAGTAGYEVLAAATKPMLCTLLIIWVGLAFRKLATPAMRTRRYGAFVISALALSLAGDVLLMYQDVDSAYFTAGLGAFLLAHVCYIASFGITYEQRHEVALLRSQGWLLIAVVGYGIFFFTKVQPYLDSLMGPVLVYTLVITIMLLTALNRYGKVSGKVFWYGVAGAVCFVASDSLLAWNKFVHGMDYAHLYIMLTYGLAQLLLAAGAVSQIREMEPNRQ